MAEARPKQGKAGMRLTKTFCSHIPPTIILLQYISPSAIILLQNYIPPSATIILLQYIPPRRNNSTQCKAQQLFCYKPRFDPHVQAGPLHKMEWISHNSRLDPTHYALIHFCGVPYTPIHRAFWNHHHQIWWFGDLDTSPNDRSHRGSNRLIVIR